jgi:hypothetical protein
MKECKHEWIYVDNNEESYGSVEYCYCRKCHVRKSQND